MKYLFGIIASMPGAAFAHGGHAELAGPGHDAFHAGPWIALICLALAVAAGRLWGRGS